MMEDPRHFDGLKAAEDELFQAQTIDWVLMIVAMAAIFALGFVLGRMMA